MKVILQIFYSIFSGALLGAAIPNEVFLFGCPVITLFALLPYYAVFRTVKDYKTAFILGFTQTLTTHLVSSFWLAYFKDFAVFTLGASAFGTACIGGFFGLFFYIPYANSTFNCLNDNKLNIHWKNSVSFRVLYFAIVYTAYEWVKSSGFLGYPWGTVFSAVFKWPILMQIASITGVYGITFIICFCNGLMYEGGLYYWNCDIYKKKKTHYYILKQTGSLLYILTVLIFFYGAYEYSIVRKPVKTVNTILVQQNSDPWKELTDSNSIILSEELTQQSLDKLKEENKKANLIVWSEGCLKYPFPSGKYAYFNIPEEKPLLEFINSTNTPFIIGGSFIRDRENEKFFNASILFDGKGNYRGVYGKNHLVPFAEALPFSEIPAVKAFLKKTVGISAGWTPGDQYVYFDIPCEKTKDYILPTVKDINLNQTFEKQDYEDNLPATVKVATPICFDDAFTDIMRPLFLNGAELFVNITDDSWSLKKSSEIQHFCIAAFKAIEYRTTLVRSANAGYSVVVDPSGKILAELPLFEQSSLSYNVPVYERKMTTYARFGNWLPYTFVIIILLFCVYSYFTFTECDYIPSERKIKKHSKKSKKKHSKHKK